MDLSGLLVHGLDKHCLKMKQGHLPDKSAVLMTSCCAGPFGAVRLDDLFVTNDNDCSNTG